MTFLEGLQSHRGGLLRLKSALFWYDGRGWDGAPGRVCLLLDTAPSIAEGLRREVLAATAYGASEKWRASATADPVAFRDAAAALLLIDGCPHWVWLNSTVVELL